MIKWIVSFEVVPGKRQQYEKFMEEKGYPFWASFSEVKSIEVFSSFRGQPNEMHFTIDDLASLDRITQHPSFGPLFSESGDFFQNTSRGIIMLRKKIK